MAFDGDRDGREPQRGEPDIAVVAALVADASRARILLALDDGRALPASRLAAEAGISPATASSHLRKLTHARLIAVEANGRYRYYRLAGPAVADMIESLQRLAPTRPIRSLREGRHAEALREARTCYDHIAGKLGVSIMGSMLDRGYLSGGDGRFEPANARRDAHTGFGLDLTYELTPAGGAFLDNLGVLLPPRRQSVRYCIDWSEQRHHLAGGIGRGLLDRLIELAWIERAEHSRALHVSAKGRTGLRRAFDLELPNS